MSDKYVMVPVELIDSFPEINPNNYSHDEVCDLNAWGCDLVLAAIAAAPKAEPQPSDGAKDAATVKDSLTAGKAQMERDSAELRRLCAERDQLKAENERLYYQLGHSEACHRLELGNSDTMRKQLAEARELLTGRQSFRQAEIDAWLEANP